jgi:cytochrome P450
MSAVEAPDALRPLEEPDDIVGAMLYRDPRWVDDPFPLYDKLREQAPVYKSGHGMWVVSSYASNIKLLRHPALTFQGGLVDDPRFPTSPTLQSYANQLEFLDPPDHDRIRNTVRSAFTRRGVATLRSYVEDLVEKLLTTAAEKGTFDWMEDFALLVPITTTCDMLGVPKADHPLFHDWVAAMHSGIFPTVSDEQLAYADTCTHELESYITALMDERRRHLGDDMLSGLIEAIDDGRLSHAEAVAMVALLLLAGQEATAQFIGIGLLTLLNHPDDIRRLRAEPSLMASTIEELLRYDSVVYLGITKTTTDSDLVLDDGPDGPVTIPEGEKVLNILAAGNRDPNRYERPNEFDIERSANHHLTFAHGVHLCLGANLGRLEGAIAFETAFRKFKEIELRERQIPWIVKGNLRGLDRLEISVTNA